MGVLFSFYECALKILLIKRSLKTFRLRLNGYGFIIYSEYLNLGRGAALTYGAAPRAPNSLSCHSGKEEMIRGFFFFKYI